MEIYPCGFDNLGNSCYMNAVMQLIVNNNYFIDYVKRKRYIEQDIEIDSCNVFDSVFAIISQKLKNKSRITLSGIVEYFREENDYGMEQQDGHDFLVSLLDKIDTDLDYEPKFSIKIDESKMNRLEYEGMRKWIEYVKKSYSLVKEVFYTQEMSMMYCLECKRGKPNFEIINHLSIGIPDEEEVSVYDCLKDYYSMETLKDDNKYHCVHCDKQTETKKKSVIIFAPKTLIIHLKRFHPTTFRKNNKKITINEELLLDEFLLTKKKTKYELKSIVCHSGSIYGGHYYNVSKMNDKWYEFDDETYKEIDTLDNYNNSCYVLSYELFSHK